MYFKTLPRELAPRNAILCSNFGFLDLTFIYLFTQYLLMIDYYHVIGGEDAGWGCGYRNFQMLYSSLLKIPFIKLHLRKGLFSLFNNH
jgi:hypothetical protein